VRILIIHDREEVRQQIEALCRSSQDEHSAVDAAVDLFEARERLASAFYDLAIVDLTLPVRHGREATIENAEILLEEIFERDDLHAPADIMGISRDPDALSVVATSVSQQLMTCLKEDGDWKTVLREKLDYLARVRRSRQRVANSSFDVDLVVVTALDKEAAPYDRLFETEACPDMAGCRRFTFTDAQGTVRGGVLHPIGQAGQAPAAAATQTLLTQFRPRLIIMTGFCGGIRERTTIGDLIGFRKVDAWDYGKWEENETSDDAVFRPRPDPIAAPEAQLFGLVRAAEGAYETDREIREAVAAASSGEIKTWRVKRGHAGSGSAVVTSDETIQSITGRNEDIRAIDMESYGFYFACSHTPVLAPDFMCLKAVADMCNGEKDNRFHEACSLISAAFVRDVVTRQYRFRT
jgi:nucleoside phosphorylase